MHWSEEPNTMYYNINTEEPYTVKYSWWEDVSEELQRDTEDKWFLRAYNIYFQGILNWIMRQQGQYDNIFKEMHNIV